MQVYTQNSLFGHLRICRAANLPYCIDSMGNIVAMRSSCLVTASAGKPKRVPILIELRGKSPRNSSPEDLLAGWAYQHDRVVPKAVLKLVIAGRAVVILEGFDEMALAGDAYARYEHFRTLWRFCYPRSKTLFTGRPNYFLDDTELKASLGIDAGTATGPYCESLRLEQFNLQQVTSALRAYPEKTRSEIVSLAGSSPKFYDLVSRGSLLYVVAELWERGGLSAYGPKINSAAVMGLFIQSSYDRQASKTGNFMVLNASERSYFMSAIAYYMAANGLPNQATKDQFWSLVEVVYRTIPDAISGQLPANSKEPRMPLRQRLSNADDAVESVVTDVRACALLVSDGSKHGALKFAHKSFMEYLAGEVLAGDMLARNTGPYEKASSRPIIDIVSEFGAAPEAAEILLRMPETLLFYGELILNSDAVGAIQGSEGRDKLSGILSKGYGGAFGLASGVFAFLKRILRVYMDMPRVFLVLSGMDPGESMQIPASLRLFVVYRVCCAIAGLPPRESRVWMVKRFDTLASRWISRNLPQLLEVSPATHTLARASTA